MGVAGVDVLLRPASRRIVEALLEGRKSLTDLAAATRVAKPSLLPTLRRLTEFGWVEREEVRASTGREVYYSLRSASVHVELRPEHGVALAWASPGPVDDEFPLASAIEDVPTRQEVLVALRSLRGKMKKAFGRDTFSIVLFGSAARGEMTWKSDIDLLFVAEPHAAFDQIQNAVADIQELVTHPVRAHIISQEDFLNMKGAIAKEAAKEGLVLHARRDAKLWSKMTRHRAISI